MKRIFLFVLTNLAIVTVLSVTMQILGIDRMLAQETGMNLQGLLVDTVKRHAQKSGIAMPEVAIYDAPEINAFATGWNKNDALVAASSGLLQNMTQDEAEAVLGHEVTHVANGDMVTLALVQGVLNTFVIFLSRVIGFLVDRVLLKNERGQGPGFWIATMVAQL